jgi:hypothetical protein
MEVKGPHPTSQKFVLQLAQIVVPKICLLPVKEIELTENSALQIF